jgi:hypothetical protein
MATLLYMLYDIHQVCVSLAADEYTPAWTFDVVANIGLSHKWRHSHWKGATHYCGDHLQLIRDSFTLSKSSLPSQILDMANLLDSHKLTPPATKVTSMLPSQSHNRHNILRR